MPSKKKKYNARFPPARIKKIMQSDEEVGKVAQVVPIIISKSLEIFVEQLLLTSSEVTRSRFARTLTPTHIKTSILSKPEFSFLRDLAQSIPDGNANVDDDEDYQTTGASGISGLNAAVSAASISNVPINLSTTSTTNNSNDFIPRSGSQGNRGPGRRPIVNSSLPASHPPTASTSTTHQLVNSAPRTRGRPRKRPLNEDIVQYSNVIAAANNTSSTTRKNQRNVTRVSSRTATSSPASLSAMTGVGSRNATVITENRQTGGGDNSDTDNSADYDDEDDEEVDEDDDEDDEEEDSCNAVRTSIGAVPHYSNVAMHCPPPSSVSTAQPIQLAPISTEDDDYDNV